MPLKCLLFIFDTSIFVQVGKGVDVEGVLIELVKDDRYDK